MNKQLFFTALLLFILLASSYGQRKKGYIDSKEIKKMNPIEIQIGERKLPKAYLFRVKNDSLDLFCQVSDLKNEATVFSELRLAVADLDHIKVTDRKAQLKYTLLTGLALGVVGYAIANRATKNKNNNDNINIIGQGGSNNTIESVLGGITGFGFGILIGKQFGYTKFNNRQKEKYVVKELKKFAYR